METSLVPAASSACRTSISELSPLAAATSAFSRRSMSTPETATWPVASTTRSAFSMAVRSFRITSWKFTLQVLPVASTPDTVPLVKVTPLFWPLR